MIEVTDVVFAVDSVPAILAVSREPFIVFASNAFAILGLRAMYFLLGDARARFHYLSHALGAILVFVGIKMALSHWWHLPTAASLAIIVGILVAAIVFSARKQRAEARRQPPASDDDPDPDAAPVPLTWEGRRILVAKLRHLRDEVVPGLLARHESEHPGQIHRPHADAEYQSAAEQIADVCSLLARARPVESTPDDPRVVELGEAVTLLLEDGTLDCRLIVHPLEAPLGGLRESSESPLGRALLGRTVGEEIEVHAPKGPYRCRILRADRLHPTARDSGR